MADTSIMECISDISIGSLATGSHGYLGNKGAVAVHMKLCDSSVVFVNAHFAAHQKDVEKRNEDYRNIISKLSFVDNTVCEALQGVQSAQSASGGSGVRGYIAQCRENISSIQQRIRALRLSMADLDLSGSATNTSTSTSSGSSSSSSGCGGTGNPSPCNILVWTISSWWTIPCFITWSAQLWWKIV